VAGRPQTVVEKVAQWFEAYHAVLSELSPPELDEAYGLLVATKVNGEDSGILELDMQAYAARVNASMAMARLTAANRRCAATVASLLVQSGIKPTDISYGDELE
jgi:hypothetical protein